MESCRSFCQWVTLIMASQGAQWSRIHLLSRRCRFSRWLGKIFWNRKWQPTPIILPGKSHGQRSLVGYSPWGCKESDMTEQLNKKNMLMITAKLTMHLLCEGDKPRAFQIGITILTAGLQKKQQPSIAFIQRQKNWCFWTVVLEKTLESPLDCKEIQLVHSKGDQFWVFFGRNDAKAETRTLATSCE